VKEIHVHAASGEEALADGAAALGLAPSHAAVEILESDEHGVTARVYEIEGAQEPAPEPAVADGEDGESGEGDAIAERAAEHLRIILGHLGLEADVKVQDRDDEVLLNVDGEELGRIIGNFGQTLNAIQFLLNLMVNTRGSRKRILVDAGGYRDRRREKLEAVAFEQAQRAKEERRGVILEGLRASERRIIHTALQNDPDVVTFSEGEEPHRRLVISPRNQ